MGPDTATVKKIQISQDLLARFEEYPLDRMDKFMMQTHLNYLAKTMCQDRVKHARSYLKSIFDEAIEQEFLTKDPSRNLKIPKNLRPKDKQVLSWEQIWEALQYLTRRDRLLVTLDLTEALRPSELFALRWRSFDDIEKLDILETVYRGKLRPYGKTEGSLTEVHLPPELAEDLRLWKGENPKATPDSFIFENNRKGFMNANNYRNRVLKPIAEKLGIPKLNFQILRRTMATHAQSMGSVKDIQAHLRHSKADTTANEYMQEKPESVKTMVGSVYAMIKKGGDSKQVFGDLLPNATNLSEPMPVSY